MRRVIVGMSGASGAIYGVRLLEALKAAGEFETHLILSPSAGRTIVEETDYQIDYVRSLATVVHKHADIGASIASGSFLTDGMIVAPCSIKSLSGIVHSYNDNLLTRAADVCLKERRPLILMVRETPLHLGHLELLVQASRYGAVVLPPVPIELLPRAQVRVGLVLDPSRGLPVVAHDFPFTSGARTPRNRRRHAKSSPTRAAPAPTTPRITNASC